MIRVPEWAFEAAGQEMRGIGQDAAAYHPGLYLTPTQVTTNFPSRAIAGTRFHSYIAFCGIWQSDCLYNCSKFRWTTR